MKVAEENSIIIDYNDIVLLNKLSHDLNNQDNRSTSYPVWVVYKNTLFPVVDNRIADGMCVFNKDTGELFIYAQDLIKSIMCDITDENGDYYPSFEWFLNDIGETVDTTNLECCYSFIIKVLGWDNFVYTPYVSTQECVSQFITENQAVSFIERSEYKSNYKLFYKVESCWDNPEMVFLIDLIKNIKAM